MDGTTRFLLGGAVGAALGFLISQRNLEKALKSARIPSGQVMPAAAPLAAPVDQPEPAPASVPTAAAVVDTPPAPAVVPAPAIAPVPARETDAVNAPELGAAPEFVPPPPLEPHFDESFESPAAEILEAPAEELPPIEELAAIEELLAEEPPTEEPTTGEPPTMEETVEPEAATESADFTTEAPETEIILTRGFLDEPVPGSGWEHRAGLGVEEEVLEEVSPTIDEELPVYPSPGAAISEGEAGQEIVVVPWLETASDSPVTQEAAAEETTLETLAIDETILEEAIAEETIAEETIAEETTLETLAIDETVLEEAVAEEAIAAETPVETLVDEEPEVEVPLVETAAMPLAETPMVQAAAAAEATAAADAPPVTARADDLKTRIEETRRRIRRELEQPFVSGDDGGAASGDWAVSSAVPAGDAAPTDQSFLSEPVESLVADVGLEEEVELPEPEAVDYESMRSRIEITRSRLKAKAFDAMMVGESALLGRDLEDAGRKRKAVTGVDDEVDETIETNLREEED